MSYNPAHEFKADLNGLRAVAVLSVVFFHFGLPLPGGFVGVDVFFVISGYLMTGILTRGDLQSASQVFGFYRNRLVRVFPALVTMTLVVIAFGWYFILPEQLTSLAWNAAYSIAFVLNFHLAPNTTYFAPYGSEIWFLHCWSLAVEFQFYVLFPLYLLVARRLSPRNGVVSALLGGVVVSLAISALATPIDANFAFYHLPSRYWEFASGGLLVMFPRAQRRQNLVAWFGLMLIALAVIFYDKSLRYPGVWPVLPVAGAMLVIWASSNVWVLTNPVMQFIGTISYSLYLWHWPLLIASRFLGLSGAPVQLLAVAPIVVLASWASYALVEHPARGNLRRGKPIWLVGAGGLLATTVTLLAVTVVSGGMASRIPVTAREMITSAAYTGGFREGKCFLGNHRFEDLSAECFRPSEDARPAMLLWGDSMTAHLYPGVAEQPWAKRYAIEQATASSCTPYDVPAGNDRPLCHDFRLGVLAHIEKTKPEVVVLGTRYMLLGGRSVERLRVVESMVRRLTEAGVKSVVVVGPLPEWEAPLPQTYFTKWRTTGAGDRMRPTNLESLNSVDYALRDIVPAAGGIYVSPAAALCDGEQCRSTVPSDAGDFLISFDFGHLTRRGSEWLAGALIGPALRQETMLPRAIRPDTTLAFKAGESGTRYLRSGWLPSEVWGTWSRPEEDGVLMFPVANDALPAGMEVEYWGQLGPLLPSERFKLEVAGDSATNLEVDLATPVKTETITFGAGALGAMMATGKLRIVIQAPEGRSPKQAGFNEDVRLLGFGIRTLKFLRLQTAGKNGLH